MWMLSDRQRTAHENNVLVAREGLGKGEEGGMMNDNEIIRLADKRVGDKHQKKGQPRVSLSYCIEEKKEVAKLMHMEERKKIRDIFTEIDEIIATKNPTPIIRVSKKGKVQIISKDIQTPLYNALKNKHLGKTR